MNIEELFELIPHKNKFLITEEEIVNYIKDLQENEDYKSRCEKIRNYVNSTNFVYDEQYKKKDKIENILNGGDEE